MLLYKTEKEAISRCRKGEKERRGKKERMKKKETKEAIKPDDTRQQHVLELKQGTPQDHEPTETSTANREDRDGSVSALSQPPPFIPCQLPSGRLVRPLPP